MRGCTSRLLSILLASLSLASANVAMASSYTGFYVFGDSLSDSGNIYTLTNHSLPSSPYYLGRFSNGPTYAENLAALLGHTATPSLLGGSNFAYGDATAGDNASVVPSLGDQVTSFRARPGVADNNALYVVWAGGNDLRNAMTTDSVDSALNGISSAIQGLYQEGARNFLVMNLSNLGLIPAVRAGGTAAMAAATNGSMLFNSGLDGLLGTLEGSLGGSDFRTLDIFSLINTAHDYPASAGLVNVINACLVGSTICDNPDSYLFWDDIHPTAAVHRLIADAAFNVLAVPEPETYALLLSGIVLIGWRARHRAGQLGR